MMTDTEIYYQALAEFRLDHPHKRREYDLTMADRSNILQRAQELKDRLDDESKGGK